MENFCFDLTAIVIGNTRQSAFRQITSFLRKSNVSFGVCDSVYSAMPLIMRAPAGRNVIVFGRFLPLTEEVFHFLSFTSKAGNIRVCCIAEILYESLQNKWQEALKAGLILVDTPEQLTDIIKQYRIGNDGGILRNKKHFAERISTLAENFFLTQDEQSALLGETSNASVAITE